jgi:sugar-specific transcriptional regulator TrmB
MDKLSNNDVISNLSELGLAPHEASVYMAVLRLGETSAGPIINEVKLHREQVYRALRNLVDQGFLTEVDKNGVSNFIAIDPTIFVNRSKTKLALAQSLLPTLSALQSKKYQIVQVWEGEEAIKRQHEDMVNTLKEGEEYLILGGVGEVYLDAAKKYIALFQPEYKRKNIKSRLIAYKGYGYPGGTPFGENVSVKTIDRPGASTPISTVIYGDKYALDIIDPDGIVIITIENKKVADSFRQTFEALWK